MTNLHTRMPRPHPFIWALLTIFWGFSVFMVPIAQSATSDDPFRINEKPPTLGYCTLGVNPIDSDLIGIPMIAQLGGVVGSIEPRFFSALRRSIPRKEIEPDLLNNANLVGYMHLSRDDVRIVLEVHNLGDGLHALRSTIDPDQVWGLNSQVFDRIGIRWPEKSELNTPPQEKYPVEIQLDQPYVESPIKLDLKTINARIKVRYPNLTRSLDNEVFRIRFPEDYNADVPAGILMWISPMDDGRIPAIFHPILDQLGLIAIGIDNNGNQRPITDRLQNHLDSIETVASRYLIDRDRVYVTGMSGGGRCAGILTLAFPDLIAGAVPIVGLDTYHNAPTGDPGKFWPARLGKPAARWFSMLKTHRIAGITGSADFNQPEMTIRQGLLKADGIDMRLDIIEGMAHAMPTADQFSSALLWVDETRRDAIESQLKEAQKLIKDYTDQFGDAYPTTPASRKSLIQIIEMSPWTDPALRAASILGFEPSN